jgi:hypothetical protein
VKVRRICDRNGLVHLTDHSFADRDQSTWSPDTALFYCVIGRIDRQYEYYLERRSVIDDAIKRSDCKDVNCLVCLTLEDEYEKNPR